MNSIVRSPGLALLLAGLIAGACVRTLPLHAQETKAAAGLGTAMVLMDGPTDTGAVVMTAWNRPDPLTAGVPSKAMIEGICLHCNIPMKFEAGQCAAKCAVCPCGATFADCLTGKSSKNTTWSAMLNALPRGTGLRVDLADGGDTPQPTVRRIYVDLKTALLPLDKPLEIADAPLLAVVKPLGVRSLERAPGDKLLRLNLKEDWTIDRAKKVTKALADHGIVVQFTPPASNKS
ncbi:MAG: hypothetical protein JWL77_2455 [Chthonomonadaceae bacterium]|nr:hypothetical protein [Chthonomonadaceae bacterium]